MKRTALILVIALLITSCASESGLNLEGNQTWIPSREDSINIALTSMRSPRKAAQLLGAESRNEFEDVLSKFQRNLAEPSWDEMVGRFDSIQALGICYGSITWTKGKRDIRFDEFIRRGFPDGEWILKGEDIRTGENLTFFEYAWGNEVAMLAGKSYPTEIRPALLIAGQGRNLPRGFSTLDLRVKAPVFLRDSTNYFHVLIVSEVSLSKINFESFYRGAVHFRTEVRDSSKNLIAREGHEVSLNPYLPIALTAVNQDQFFILDHCSLKLEPGLYKVKVTASGDGNCYGESSFYREVPPRTIGRIKGTVDISDMLFIDPNPPRGNLNNLVSKWGRNDLWPASRFSSGMSVVALTEVAADTEGIYIVTVSVSPRKGTDSLENTLLSRAIKVDGRVLVELPLEFEVEPGPYWLRTSVVKADDPIIRSEAITPIEIKDRDEAAISTEEIATDNKDNTGEAQEQEADSITISELRAMVKIIAPKLHRKYSKASDTIFLAALENYKTQRDFEERPDTPTKNEWWEEMVARWHWGDTHLKTPIDGIQQDARWPFIMLLGTDFEEQKVTTDATEDFAVSVWVCKWDEENIFAFEPDKGGSLPSKVRVWNEGDEVVFKDPLRDDPSPNKEERGKIAQINLIKKVNRVKTRNPDFAAFQEVNDEIESLSRISCLLPKDEYNPLFEVWISNWTLLNSFGDSALVNDTLTLRAAVYKQDFSFVGEAVEVRPILGESFSSLSKESPNNREGVVVPAYVGFRLSYGEYHIVVSVSGNNGRSLGIKPFMVNIPPRSMSWIETDSLSYGVSDIVIPMRGDGTKEVAYGVGFDEGVFFSNNPAPIFNRNEAMPVVVQAKVPPNSECQVLAAIARIIEDENLFRPVFNKPRANSEHILDRINFRSGESGRETIKLNLDLSVIEKPGRYAVIVRVMEPDEGSPVHHFGISWRPFLLK